MSEHDDWIDGKKRELQRIVARLRAQYQAEIKPYLERLVDLEKVRRRGPTLDALGVSAFLPPEFTPPGQLTETPRSRGVEGDQGIGSSGGSS